MLIPFIPFQINTVYKLDKIGVGGRGDGHPDSAGGCRENHCPMEGDSHLRQWHEHTPWPSVTCLGVSLKDQCPEIWTNIGKHLMIPTSYIGNMGTPQGGGSHGQEAGEMMGALCWHEGWPLWFFKWKKKCKRVNIVHDPLCPNRSRQRVTGNFLFNHVQSLHLHKTKVKE